MRMKNRELGNINSSGGLLSEHFLVLMRVESISLPFAAPKTFKLPWSKADASLDKKEYDRRVSESWNKLLERWDLYGYGKLQRMDPADARARWTGPLLEALGFEPVAAPKHIEISESMKFRFSHRGWFDSPDNGKPPVVHIVPPAQDLDERSEKGMPSPHDAMQAYLNVHEDKWALVTNGLYLRILRDYHHTYTKGYVEFDLEAIFLTRSFSDFQALYRIAHASRFLPADAGEVYLEEYFKHSQSVGEKIGAGLRKNVLQAITTLGNGFLDAELLSELKSDPAKCHKFYEEILKTVYRIIFLLYAEQRGMLGGSEEHNLYLEEYSLTALRERAASYSKADDHKDHWIGLKNTFRIIWKGSPELGIYPYNGMLFETSDEEYTSKYDCKNSELLGAIRYLTLTEIDGTARRISYSEIDVTEIGAIYEGLLDYTPRVIDLPEEIEGIPYSANSFILDPRGSARKTSGSYYTHQDLVQELIKSALEPVLVERLRSAGPDKEAREMTILSIKVCDMTSGSGAFLLAACNRLALELARVRMEPAVPDDDAIQEAKRDVLQSCIYGVDLNPMAVELAKVSLWINAMVKDKPLNFLDHHIKCGNSLIGATPELIAQGIPDGAFDVVTGDDKKVAKYFKDINQKQRKGTLDKWSKKAQSGYAEEFARLSEMDEDSVKGVVDKCRAYHKLKDIEEFRRKKLEADAWTAAFFLPLNDTRSLMPTTGEVARLGREGVSDDALTKQVDALAKKYRFFHWHLEFPEVFAAGGFDVILGNPPWEKIQSDEVEFFIYLSPEIADETDAIKRKTEINRLKDNNPKLSELWLEYKKEIELQSKFIIKSNRRSLSAKGNLNLYRLFTDLARELVRNQGRAGLIVQSGIATDDLGKEFFADLMIKGQIDSLYDFDNTEGIFDIHRMMKFSLITLRKSISRNPTKFAFFLKNVRDIQDKQRIFSLTTDEIALINPNTRNCPMFRGQLDAKISKKIYRNSQVLLRESQEGENAKVSSHDIDIDIWGEMFNMTRATKFIKQQIEEKGKFKYHDGNVQSNYIPLYESKLIHIFDHRFGTFKDLDHETCRKGHANELEDSEKINPDCCVETRYWVKKEDFISRISGRKIYKKWFFGLRSITSANNERTTIGSIIPYVGVGNSINLILINSSTIACYLLSNMTTFVFDFASRQKVGNQNLNIYIIKQLPIINYDVYIKYKNPNKELIGHNIIKIALELTYTTWDIKAFADDLWREADEPLRATLKQQWDENFAETDGGHAGAEPPSWAEIAPDGFPYPPFKWDEERRARLRAELDAIYAHLYGLSREELDYILETFPIVKRKDVEKYGSYRTKEMILRYYEMYDGNSANNGFQKG